MGNAFLYGSGGGSGLNFEVKAYASEDSLPATAKENTIAVITETPITAYTFSATEPTDPIEGAVWIRIGAASPVEFNALKKNEIRVYPVSAKQYVSGAWVGKTAKSYQGGEWVAWVTDTFLYNKGDFCTDVTGGWKSISIVDGSNRAGTLAMADNGSSITLWATMPGDYTSTAGYVVENEIDVTHFKQLTINVTGVEGTYGCSFFLCVFTPGMTNWSSGTIASKQFTATGETTLDISSVSGEVGIGIKVTNNYSSVFIKMTYDSVCLNV